MSFPAQGLGGGSEISQVLNLLQSIAGGNQSQGCSGQDGQQGQQQFEKILHELQKVIGQIEGQSGPNGAGQ
jgi:hypothetical protein